MIKLLKKISRHVKTDFFASTYDDVRFSNGKLVKYDDKGHGQAIGIGDKKENYFYTRIISGYNNTGEKISCNTSLLQSTVRLVAVAWDVNPQQLEGFILSRLRSAEEHPRVVNIINDYDTIWNSEMPNTEIKRPYNMHVVAIDFDVKFLINQVVAENPCDWDVCQPEPALICRPANLVVNSQTIASIISGGTFSLRVVDDVNFENTGLFDPVNNWWIVPGVECDDATITINSELFGTVEAGGVFGALLEYDDETTPDFTLVGNKIIIDRPVCPSIQASITLSTSTPDQFEQFQAMSNVTGDVSDPVNLVYMWIVRKDGNVVSTSNAPNPFFTLEQSGVHTIELFVGDTVAGLFADDDETVTVQPTEAAELLEAFIERVETVGGEIESADFYRELYDIVINHNYQETAKTEAIFLLPNAMRVTADTSRVNKIFDMFNPANDVEQTSAGLQPLFGMREGLRTLDMDDISRRLVFSGSALNFFRNTDYAEVLVFTSVTGAGIFLSYSANTTGATRLTAYRAGGSQMSKVIRRVDGAGFSSENATENSVLWKLLRWVIDYGNDSYELIRNETLLGSGSMGLGSGSTSDTASVTARIGSMAGSVGGNSVVGQHLGVIAFRQPPPPQMRGEIIAYIKNKYNIA